MKKRFVFHYDTTLPDDKEPLDEGGISPHDILLAHDGCECVAYVDREIPAYESIEIFFDDGNEFSAWKHELEPIND